MSIVFSEIRFITADMHALKEHVHFSPLKIVQLVSILSLSYTASVKNPSVSGSLTMVRNELNENNIRYKRPKVVKWSAFQADGWRNKHTIMRNSSGTLFQCSM